MTDLMGVRWTHEMETGAWYFCLEDPLPGADTAPVWIDRTESLGARQVNLDWDTAGNLVGVEVL